MEHATKSRPDRQRGRPASTRTFGPGTTATSADGQSGAVAPIGLAGGIDSSPDTVAHRMLAGALNRNPRVAALRAIGGRINSNPRIVAQRKLAQAIQQRSRTATRPASSRGVTSGQTAQCEDGEDDAARERIVEGAQGPVALPQLTLLDFMQGALSEMRARDRARQQALAVEEERRQRAAEEQSRREAEERRRREAEEAAQREEEERQRLEALERQRRQAEERLRQEEEERQRLEAEQKKAADRAAAEKRWVDAVKAISDRLVQQLRVQVGDVWIHLQPGEQDAAIQEIGKVVQRPYSDRAALESLVRKPSKRAKALVGDELAGAVLTRIESDGSEVVGSCAATLREIGAKRAQEAAHQAEVAKPVTTAALVRLTQTEIPSGADLMELYRAAAQHKLELVHNATYRTDKELERKRASHYGPFSREFGARIYGTVHGQPGRYEWCTWVVHVHFRTSERPTEIEYLHLKKRSERRKPINHVMNRNLHNHLSPLVVASINPGLDFPFKDIK
jgi:hypothetical protein